MCRGGRFLASFTAGTTDQPEVPEVVQSSLTLTEDGVWVVWAHKVARPFGDEFLPITGGEPYPRDAVASCRKRRSHAAPHRDCTCGFHALSAPYPVFGRRYGLEVMLSGRVLAFEWDWGGVLFRGERQTVIRADTMAPPSPPPPSDPAGWLARREGRDPRGAGPIRLRQPRIAPPIVAVDDDAGYCLREHAPHLALSRG